MGRKMKKKNKVIFLVTLIIVLLATYFRPRTLGNTLGLEDIESNGIAYCYFADISQANNTNWSGTAADLLGQSNELLGPLLHEVSISGPVFYKRGAINADLLNLHLSLPKQDGTHQSKTLELILSNWETDKYSVFINLGKKGYFVTSGKSTIASFIQKARDTVADTSRLP